MQIKNSQERFGIVAISLHWLIALMILTMLTVGLYMVRLPIGPDKLKIYGLHKEFGLLVLALASLRIIWRLFNTVPKLSLPLLEKIAARTAHYLLYGLMIAMPITGWGLSSAAGFSPSFFGLFTMPNLVAPNEHLRILFGEIHEYLAYTLIVVIALHVAGALKHHFIDKNDILRRMMP